MARKLEYKPLLYTTTVRNPERYKDFMSLLKKYDGRLLNNETVCEFEKDLFKVGLYKPMKRPVSVIEKWNNVKKGELGQEALTDDEATELYLLNDPNEDAQIKGHKEAGFPKGWPSRFETQFKLMKVLGFLYYNWGEKIVFSPTGKYLAESVEIKIENGIISRTVINPLNEQIAFLQAFAKQQRCNPFIRELNDNIPLILLLQVIKKINSNPKFKACGISYKELPLLIFWKNSL